MKDLDTIRPSDPKAPVTDIKHPTPQQKPSKNGHFNHIETALETAQASNLKSSLLDSTFLHQIGDLLQDIALLIISLVLFVKPDWDIIDPIVSIILSFASKYFIQGRAVLSFKLRIYMYIFIYISLLYVLQVYTILE